MNRLVDESASSTTSVARALSLLCPPRSGTELKVPSSSSRVVASRPRLQAALRRPPRKLLPPPHDHVAVQRIQFHQIRPPPGLLGGDERRAGAAEEVEHVFARARRVLQRRRDRPLPENRPGEVAYAGSGDALYVPSSEALAPPGADSSA